MMAWKREADMLLQAAGLNVPTSNSRFITVRGWFDHSRFKYTFKQDSTRAVPS
jgi:hypothetical protein